MPCAEKTLDYCSCLANYTYVSNGTTYHSDGGCIQDNPDIPPWCIVYEKSCSQPPPKKPDGQFWDICRGAACELHASFISAWPDGAIAVRICGGQADCSAAGHGQLAPLAKPTAVTEDCDCGSML